MTNQLLRSAKAQRRERIGDRAFFGHLAIGHWIFFGHWVIGDWSFVPAAAAENLAEDQVQFLRFAPKLASFVLQVGFGRGCRAQKKLRLLRLLLASADLVNEFLL